MTIGMGIDTGETYTDAVLLEMETGRILHKSKDLTTRQDLVLGIRGAIARLDQKLLARTSIVSLSSTLATNSIVEGKGCRVGLICLGLDYDRSVEVDSYACLPGRHDLDGKETQALDRERTATALRGMQGMVDSVAITGFLSIRNPEHELQVAALAHEILQVPVVCGHELSSGLGFNERTTTAVMNARLIPVITDLIRSVKQVLNEFSIQAPLMIVKGDGTIMGETMAIERPVETILSGPASSLTGAMALTGVSDAIMMDIGGTTTDIGVLRGGFPRLEAEGALIGGHRTRVLAAAVSTYGLGGDSRLVVNGTDLLLTPVRVIPICIAATIWPHIGVSLERLAQTDPSHAAESFRISDLVQETEFFIASRPLGTEILQPADRALLNLIQHEPYSLSEAGAVLNIHPFNFNAARLEELGLVQRIGVTPTDLLHAEGSYVEYNRHAAELAIGYLARKARLPTNELIAEAKRLITVKLCRCLMADLILEDSGYDKLDPVAQDLLGKAISGRDGLDFGVRIKLNKPIIGIGAPVAAWLPAVASIFGTQLIIPRDSDVGNAAGAVTGSVAESVHILIRPTVGAVGNNPPCLLFAKFGKFSFPTVDAGIAFAKAKGGEYVTTISRQAGANDIVLSSHVEKKTYTSATDSSEGLLEVLVTVTATGKPILLADRISADVDRIAG